MKCNNCGAMNPEESKYCQYCGNQLETAKVPTPIDEVKTTTDNNPSNSVKTIPKKKKAGPILRYIFGILFIGTGLSEAVSGQGFRYTIAWLAIALCGATMLPVVAEKFLSKIKVKKIALIAPLVCFGLYIVFLPKVDVDVNENANNTSSETSTTVAEEGKSNAGSITTKSDDKTTTNKSNAKAFSSIKNETLKSNLAKACAEIKADTSEIKDLQENGNWSSGTCYHFTYKSNAVEVYVNEDNTINSINMHGNKVKVYEQGFTPLNIEDYVVNFQDVSYIQIAAENAIMQFTNYPKTVDFHWITSGGYARFGDVYAVSGKFDAQNAFGVESEHSFVVEEKKNGSSFSAIYVVVDRKVYSGKESITEAAKTELSTKASSSGAITLKYGAKGNYGKIDKYDGEEYIRYYVPAGKYTVTALASNSNFYIESQSIHKEDGYDVSDTIRTIYLKTKGDKETIEIKSNQCISLMINANVELTPIK